MEERREPAAVRTGKLRVKRIYEPPDASDGVRVLVDRIWPRGVTREDAKLAVWMKEVAPSPALRTWFGHDPDKFEPFAARYEAELSEPRVRPYLERLRQWAERDGVTLLYAARDERHNHAVVLKRFLERTGL